MHTNSGIMMLMMNNVWEKLTYENIFSSVEKIISSRLLNICIKRNSYINRVYELEKYDNNERLIVKFYRPGRWTKEMILEEHSFVNDLAKNEIPVIPPVNIDNNTLFDFDGIYFALFNKKGGRALDEFDKEGWKGIGRLLGRIHLISKHREKSNRIVWRPNTATSHHLDILVGTKAILPDFENSFLSASRAFIDFAEKRFSETEPVSILIHGDCHRGNFIHRPGEGVYLVDFDDICQGPPVQDLWMLLPDTVEKSQNELSWFFEGYETFNQFDRASLELIPILRGMRLIHFASWCAIQKDEPHFDQHFHDWGSKKYWNELIKVLNGIIYAPDEE